MGTMQKALVADIERDFVDSGSKCRAKKQGRTAVCLIGLTCRWNFGD